MTARLPCRTDGCAGAILPATSERTGGYCMPCVQRREREEREQFIRERRVDVDRYAGVIHPVEVLRIMHARLAPDPLRRDVPHPRPRSEIYASLSAAQCAQVVDDAITTLRIDPGAAEEIASCLACFTNADLGALQQALLTAGDAYPSEVFRGASQPIVGALVRLAADRAGDPVGGHALSALAWSRHPDALDAFDTWRRTPPRWATKHFIPVHRYAEVAGWSFDARGAVRQLHRSACWALVSDSTAPSALDVVRHTESICRRCRTPITALCALDLRSPELMLLGFAGTRLTLPVCEWCHAYGHAIFFEVASDGGFTWSDASEAGAAGATDLGGVLLPRMQLGLGPPRGAMHGASWLRADHHSYLGGLPGWVDDPAYPVCPGCSERMIFVAQVSASDFAEPGEGVYYAFLCETCRLSSAAYQQT